MKWPTLYQEDDLERLYDMLALGGLIDNNTTTDDLAVRLAIGAEIGLGAIESIVRVRVVRGRIEIADEWTHHASTPMGSENSEDIEDRGQGDRASGYGVEMHGLRWHHTDVRGIGSKVGQHLHALGVKSARDLYEHLKADRHVPGLTVPRKDEALEHLREILGASSPRPLISDGHDHCYCEENGERCCSCGGYASQHARIEENEERFLVALRARCAFLKAGEDEVGAAFNHASRVLAEEHKVSRLDAGALLSAELARLGPKGADDDAVTLDRIATAWALVVEELSAQ